MPSSRNLWKSRLLLVLLLSLMAPVIDGCKKKVEEAPEVSVTVQAAHPTLAPISEEITADAVSRLSLRRPSRHASAHRSGPNMCSAEPTCGVASCCSRSMTAT